MEPKMFPKLSVFQETISIIHINNSADQAHNKIKSLTTFTV